MGVSFKGSVAFLILKGLIKRKAFTGVGRFKWFRILEFGLCLACLMKINRN